MWTTIIQAVLGTVLSAVQDWWRAEQAESAKWAAEARGMQLESIKVGQQVEQDYLKALEGARGATSGSMWNAKVVALLLMAPVLLSMQGCFRFYVAAEPYRPVPPKIERPVLEDESPFSAREEKLAAYAESLAVVYRQIRRDAIEANERNGFPTPEE